MKIFRNLIMPVVLIALILITGCARGVKLPSTPDMIDLYDPWIEKGYCLNSDGTVENMHYLHIILIYFPCDA